MNYWDTTWSSREDSMDDNMRKLTRAESGVTCAAEVERKYAKHPQETLGKPTERGGNATTAHRSHPGARSSRWWGRRSNLFPLRVSSGIPNSKASSPLPSRRPPTDPRRHLDDLGDLYAESGQTLQGSFSAVSTPIFASKYSLESSRRDLHNALLCTALRSRQLPHVVIHRVFSGRPRCVPVVQFVFFQV